MHLYFLLFLIPFMFFLVLLIESISCDTKSWTLIFKFPLMCGWWWEDGSAVGRE